MYSSTTWSAKTRTARSSGGTARPGSDVRGSGSARDISAKRSGLRPRSTPPKSSRIREESMSIQALALAFLAATAIGGLAWVFIYPSLSGQKKAESRRASIARSDAPARQVEKSQRSRREQVEGSLKELDARRKKERSVPLTVRLAQAGLGSWTPQKFWMVSGISGAVGFVLAYVIGGHPLGAPVMAFGTGLGLPRWALGYLKKRRENAFLKALPDAVDVVVRGIKAGLPLFESIKVVAADSPEPLRSGFNTNMETQTVGRPLRRLDDDRRPRDEENDQFRLLTVRP